MTIGVTLLGLLLAALVAGQPSEVDRLEQGLLGDPAQKRQAIDFAVAHAASTPAALLYMGATVALDQGRLEDAGFLYYAAQLRFRFDVQAYPPRGRGSEHPSVLLGALNQQVGAAVNPAIMREPKAFKAVVERLRAWELQAAPYDPGWKHSPRLPSAQIIALAQRMKREYMAPAEGFSTLLNTPEYFEAYRTLQDLNLEPPAEQGKPEHLAAKQRAEERARAIEEKMGIPGLFHAKPPVAPRSVTPAPGGTMPRRVGPGVPEPKKLRHLDPVLPAPLPADAPSTVILELTVTPQGRVAGVHILRGHPAVDQAVSAAVKQWTYEPAPGPAAVMFTTTLKLR